MTAQFCGDDSINHDWLVLNDEPMSKQLVIFRIKWRVKWAIAGGVEHLLDRHMSEWAFLKLWIFWEASKILQEKSVINIEDWSKDQVIKYTNIWILSKLMERFFHQSPLVFWVTRMISVTVKQIQTSNLSFLVPVKMLFFESNPFPWEVWGQS